MELDPYEQEILEAFEAGRMEPVEDEAGAIRRAQAGAERYFHEKEEVHLQLTRDDAYVLRQQAERSGASSEQLMADILHQYAAGMLQPRTQP